MCGQACCSTQGFFMSKVLPISHILCRQLCSCVVNDVVVGTHHSLNCRHVMHCSESRQLSECLCVVSVCCVCVLCVVSVCCVCVWSVYFVCADCVDWMLV